MRWMLISGLCVGAVFAGPPSGTVQSTRLYTPPDPAARGGIRGTTDTAVEAVFAIPIHDPSKVYRAELSGGGREFSFRGLPVGKYDLLVLCADRFYEGFTLTRESDTLTDRDRAAIKETIGRAVPFFDTKQIHRVAGTTGSAGNARCVLQELRTGLILAQSAEELKNTQIRSLKLAWLEDVGATGWQLINTRELVRQEVTGAMPKGILPHQHDPRLGNIRVTDDIKDLGPLLLPPPPAGRYAPSR